MVDLHTHVLPGIDDGPETPEDAVELVAAMAQGGVRTVVATPHVSPGYPNTSGRITDAAAILRGGLADAGVDVEVVEGAEVDLVTAIELDEDELFALHLGDGPYLLIESPLSPAAADIGPLVFELARRGHRIVLAHPERAPTFLRDQGRLVELVAEGVLTSITAASMSGRFGGLVHALTIDLLAGGLVHNVASDAHDIRRRAPGLSQGFADAERDVPGVSGFAEWMTALVPAAILSGDPLPEAPAAPERPKRRRRWPFRA